MKKILSLLFITIIFSSCSTRYGVIAGAQKTSYSESGTIGSVYSNYENSSTGFHIGISEESKYILTKIYYFSNTYPDKVFTLEGVDFDTKLSESGFKGTIALKLWGLQPYIGFTSYNTKYTVDETQSDEKYSTVTAGIDLEIPISENGYIYFGASTDTYNNMGASSAGLVDQLITHEMVYAGLRFNFTDYKTSK